MFGRKRDISEIAEKECCSADDISAKLPEMPEDSGSSTNKDALTAYIKLQKKMVKDLENIVRSM